MEFQLALVLIFIHATAILIHTKSISNNTNTKCCMLSWWLLEAIDGALGWSEARHHAPPDNQQHA